MTLECIVLLRGTVVSLARVYTLHDSWHELTSISSTSHDAEEFTGWKHEEQLCVENHAMYKLPDWHHCYHSETEQLEV